jgi:glycosyltransferase involved in cell wall biosynthesis
MHLAVVTQYYPPELGAPQARLSELAAAFAQRGHRVTVLTAMPSYPTGRIFPGYGGLFRTEVKDGVTIVRVPIYPTQRADLLRRLGSYFSFVATSAVGGTLTIGRADYLMVESPPLFLGLSGLWLARAAGARMIFNVSDLWPETAVRLGIVREGAAAHRVAERLEALCYERSWLVTGQSKTILADISERFPDCRTFHLSNGVDTTRFGPERHTAAARRLLADGPGEFAVLYAGLHGLAQGLEQLLEAADMLDGLPFRFTLIGDGPEKGRLQEVAAARGLSNVRFHPPRPAEEIPALLAAADVVVVTLKSYIPGAVPSKIYEAMATGRPVVLVASGEAAEIVHRHHAGFAVEPGDVEGLAETLHRLREQPDLCQLLGRNGREAAERYFDRAEIARRFIDYLEADTDRMTASAVAHVKA